MTFVHLPVLSSEVVEHLAVDDPQVYVDLTSGGGGHASLIIERFPNARAVLIDRDPDAVLHLKEKFKGFKNVTVVRSKAGEVDKVLFLLKIDKADIILADLGVSSHQFDTPSRGFSVKSEGPFDMRMDGESDFNALDFLKKLTEFELKNILSEYAQERESGRVARALKQAVSSGASTTLEFAEAVRKAKRFFPKGIDPATQVFMAIRMAVNDEMGELEKMLERSFKLLSDGGRMGIITFHSTEDRIVKRFFRERKEGLPYYIDGDKGDIVSCSNVKVEKPFIPDSREIGLNPRSRSAKLRIIEKLKTDK
jgi:16S rRNA (cytosine1402-N4)-methyltransferase